MALLPNITGIKNPNFAQIATQQAQQSQQNTDSQTNANRPGQTTPWGSTTWAKDANGNWTQNTSLNPTQQGTLDQQQGNSAALTSTAGKLTGQIDQNLSQPMDWSGFMAGGDRVNGGQYYNDAATQAVTDKFNLEMDPRYAREDLQLEQTLRNRGVNPGDAGYDQQLQLAREAQNKARESARLQAILTGGAEGARMQGMDINAGNYNTDQRKSQIDEAVFKRNQPLSEFSALNTAAGGPVTMPTMPSFNSAGRAETPDLLGAADSQYEAGIDKDNANTDLWGSILGGVNGAMNDREQGGSGGPFGSILGGVGGAAKGAVSGAANGGGIIGGLKGAGAGALKGLGLGGGGAAAATGAGLSADAALAASLAPVGGATGAAGATAATAGAAAGGGSGAMATLTAAAPWAAAAIAAAAVIAHNIPDKSRYHDDVRFNPDGTVSLTTQFKDKGIDSAQVNAFYGPMLNEFAKTGDLTAAMAKMPKPQTPQQQFLADPKQMIQLFKGTGNPFRNISMKKGFGKGPWSEGNKEIIPGLNTTRQGKAAK